MPVRVSPAVGFRGGSHEVAPTASSQFISAVMLVAPWSDEGIELRFQEEPTSASYLELTAQCMRKVGATVEFKREQGRLARIDIARQVLGGFDVSIESDASSAIYPAALAAMLRCSRVEILGLPADSFQPDLAAVKALEVAGVGVQVLDDRVVVTSPDVLEGFDLDCSMFPDAAVMLAVLAARCRGRTRLCGLQTLRVKETDRIAALANELRRFGCTVETQASELLIQPGVDAGEEVLVRTYDDHRMAMAFAILGSVRGNVGIENPACAAKSHPGFWEELAGLTGRGETGDTA